MTGARVLIVESTGREGHALAQALSQEGLIAKAVANGTSALREVCGEAPPDLVLMDMDLPDMDGLSAIARVKSVRRAEFLPVIALSSREDSGARVSALRGGADDVLTRPWLAEELAARAAALLRIRASQGRLHRANRELERRSFTDPLTGLFNRRYFEYQLAQELERARRQGDPVALMLVDLDHFKDLNDRYGHAVGDEVLKAVGLILRSELRRLDICSRWGGEEFAAIMPNTSTSGAAVACERVMAALRTYADLCAAPLDGSDRPGEVVRFTASLGVAVYSDAGDGNADKLFRRADLALYRAKRQGRDRACLAEDPSGAGHHALAEVPPTAAARVSAA